MHIATYIAIPITAFWAVFHDTPYVSPICAIIISICSFLSFFSYETLKDRIKTLEDKMENNAEHIHKLSKKQSNQTVEYYVDCDKENDK